MYKRKNLFLFGKDESLWPCIDCHTRGVKQREKASAGYAVFCIAAAYMLKNQNEFK